MDHKSQRLLNETYLEVRRNQKQKRQEEQVWKEVQAFANDLVAEGYDISDMTWDEVREAYLEENLIGDTFARGAGQIKRAGMKAFGNAQQRNDAVSFERSVNDINKRKRESGDTSKTTQNDIDAETSGRRKADPNYKPGQGVGSGNEPAKVQRTRAQNRRSSSDAAIANTNSKGQSIKVKPNSSPNSGSGNSGPNSTTKTTTKPVPAAQTGDKKADMKSWAAANPKLAAAKAKRDATRGTSATTNPMMKDLKKRMPKPTPAASKPDGSKLRAMSKPSLNTESVDQFDIRYNELRRKGFDQDEILNLMYTEGMVKHESEKKSKDKNKKRIMRVELCPMIKENVLEYYFEEWISESIEEGYDLSSYYEIDLWENFLKQVANDPELVMELRRSEKEGKGSPESRSDRSPSGYLGGDRQLKKDRGERGGRHPLSGGGVGSESSRGKKKGEAGSEHDRMNPKEKEGRQLDRGSKAAERRAYGYGSGRYQGD